MQGRQFIPEPSFFKKKKKSRIIPPNIGKFSTNIYKSLEVIPGSWLLSL
jgi:hypothetical protein